MSTLYQDIKRWWKSKTIAFSGSIALFGQAVDYLHTTGAQWADRFGEWGGTALTLVGLTGLYLRFKTKGAVAVRKPKDDTDEAGA